MIYRTLKFLVWIAVKIYFRQIHFTHAAHIPSKGAVLLVANHPNSFLDAVVLAVLMQRPLHFLARSDVFDQPWKQWILNKLHMIPIYRLQEGKENLSKNEITFERCEALFRAGEVVLIFPEGLSIPEKRLRKLKKGAAKIAFQSEEKNDFGLGIQVVCASINYTHPLKARKTLLIDFAPPFPLIDFKTDYQQQAAQTVHAFNQKIEQKISERMVIIAQKSSEKLAEQVLTLGRNEMQTDLNDAKNRLRIEQEILQKLPSIDTALAQDIQAYFQTLLQQQVKDSTLKNQASTQSNYQTIRYLSLPVYALGLLFYLLPVRLAHQLAEKTTKNTQFYTSVHFALHFSFVFLLQLAVWVCTWIILGIAYALLAVILLLLLGIFTLHYAEWILQQQQQKNLKKLAKKEATLLIELQNKRADIIQRLGRIAP